MYLRELLDYIDGPRFPADFDPVPAEVTGRPNGAFTQAIIIAAGSKNGIRVNDPVVTADGLVGVVIRVPRARPASSCSPTRRLPLPRSTCEPAPRESCGTRAERARLSSSTAFASRTSCAAGTRSSRPGWRAGTLSSLYPKGIPIGKVTSVGQTDTDLFQQVQVDPYVDFGSLDAVLVLVPTGRRR